MTCIEGDATTGQDEGHEPPRDRDERGHAESTPVFAVLECGDLQLGIPPA
jgi:hypothetical protein